MNQPRLTDVNLAESPKVERVAEGLMHTGEVSPRHEHLVASVTVLLRLRSETHTLEGCRAGTWMRDAENWLLRHG